MVLIVTPEELARHFHETYERLAPNYQYKTRRETAVPWDELPESNRQLMIAVSAEILALLTSTATADTPRTSE